MKKIMVMVMVTMINDVNGGGDVADTIGLDSNTDTSAVSFSERQAGAYGRSRRRQIICPAV